MLVLTVGETCSEPLRQAVDDARCFSDAFETVRPLAYHSDCFVTLVRCRASGETVVVKAYIRHTLGDGARKQVAAEARIHSNLDHPHIVPLLLAFEDSQHSYLAIQHAEDGDLRKQLQGRLQEHRVRDWLVVPLLQALAAVHQQGVVHRDIKPENVLLHKGKPMLADFGMSIYSCTPAGLEPSTAPLTAGGTPLYTAPEVMLAMFKNTGVGHVVGPKNDIWALGLVVLEALAGCHPFNSEQAADGNVLYTIANCSRVNLPQHLSPSCQAFLAAALCRDPEQRLSAEALLQHPWITAHLPGVSGSGTLATTCQAAAISQYKQYVDQYSIGTTVVVSHEDESWEF